MTKIYKPLSKARGPGHPFQFHIFFNKAFLVFGCFFFYTWSVLIYNLCQSNISVVASGYCKPLDSIV